MNHDEDLDICVQENLILMLNETLGVVELSGFDSLGGRSPLNSSSSVTWMDESL